jgi:shikimate dehydrogenase
MQQAAIDFYGLPLQYESMETNPDDLPSLMEAIRSEQYLGVNVTIPYKQAVIPFLDRLERKSRRIGAVNTILNQNGRLTGYNTDAEGFQRALEDDGRFEIAGCRAVLLGAGGVARAVAVTLAEAMASSVTIANRHRARSTDLVNSLRRRRGTTAFTQVDWGPGQLWNHLAECSLLVNCTSVGMKHSPTEGESPLPADLIPPQAVVFDLVYNPAETVFLNIARLKGARVLGGLPMLVYQGVAAFEIWTGKQAPVGLMRARAEQALSQL